MTAITTSIAGTTRGRPAWSAVYAMALAVAVLIASEFMPVSLLSPIARELGLSEGQAGQAISISGIFAVLTSLSITGLAGMLDRRIVLVGLTALLAISGTIVVVAPSFPVLMIGRALLGIAIGGFWSMSAATVMRLVSAAAVTRGLAIIYGGNAIATTIAAPLGSFMGGLIGWRGAFFVVVPLAVTAAIWQAVALPPLPAEARQNRASMVSLLANPPVMAGLIAVMLLFMGQFALFTYLRPFLEQVTGVNVSTLSALLLIVGVAGFVGTSCIGRLLEGRLHIILVVIPAVMACTATGLALAGRSLWTTAALLGVWGLVGTAAPVAWSTWLTRTLPDDAEAGGGLMVAAIQLAITAGATIGGLVLDALGPIADFLGSAAILALAALVALLACRAHLRNS